MKAFLTDFLKWFLTITTGILVVVWISCLKYDTMSTLIIPEIFGASFATSLVTTAVFSINPRKPLKPAVRVLIFVVHYLVLCGIIMTLGTLFGWFELTLKGGLSVILSVAIVYALSAVISYILSRGEAKEMTDALRRFKDDK